MAEQAGVLGDVRLQFQDFFGSLSIAKRVTVLVSLLIVLVGMVSIIIISNQDSWAPLYSNLETQDAARIVQKLQENQIPYLLGPGGNSVMVHPEMADQARLTLASEKVLPGGGIGFLDLFEQPALGETEFQQQVKYRIAQEGELARLIGMIDSIDRKLEPMTDEQIIKIWENHQGDTRLSILAFARAIEKEHGIQL